VLVLYTTKPSGLLELSKVRKFDFRAAQQPVKIRIIISRKVKLLDQNTSSTKTIPRILKYDRKIRTCLMLHNRRPQLSAKARFPFGKSDNWHIFTHVFVPAAQHTEGQRKAKFWGKYVFFFPLVLRYYSQ